MRVLLRNRHLQSNHSSNIWCCYSYKFEANLSWDHGYITCIFLTYRSQVYLLLVSCVLDHLFEILSKITFDSRICKYNKNNDWYIGLDSAHIFIYIVIFCYIFISYFPFALSLSELAGSFWQVPLYSLCSWLFILFFSHCSIFTLPVLSHKYTLHYNNVTPHLGTGQI